MGVTSIMANRTELNPLLDTQNELCDSIYMPTHRGGVESHENPVRLNNLLRSAEESLVERGLTEVEARELLASMAEIAEERVFWQHPQDGLAVFCSASVLRWYRLPFAVPEQVVVGKRFHILPILSLFTAESRFYVLSLSQNAIRLFHCTGEEAQAVALHGMPLSLDDFMLTDTPERQIHLHAGVPAGTAVFHGRAQVEDRIKDNLLRFFQRLDRGLHPLLRDEHAPLVLAGVEYLIPIYRRASTYPHLVKEAVFGNPDEADGRELRLKAWPLAAPVFDKARRQALERLKESLGTGRASTDPCEILPAALGGRVESLFVEGEHPLWGQYDPSLNSTTLHAECVDGDEDLRNLAAAITLLDRGGVFVATKDELPGGAELAAVFRY